MRISFSIISEAIGNFIKAENAPSKNGGNKAPNQFIFHFTNGKVFQSYETIVAAYVGNQLYLSPEHDCSATTNRFVKQFTGLSKSERNKGIEDGTICLFC